MYTRLWQCGLKSQRPVAFLTVRLGRLANSGHCLLACGQHRKSHAFTHEFRSHGSLQHLNINIKFSFDHVCCWIYCPCVRKQLLSYATRLPFWKLHFGCAHLLFFFLPVGSAAHAPCGRRLYLHVTMLPINLVDRDACTIILLLCCCVIVL